MEPWGLSRMVTCNDLHPEFLGGPLETALLSLQPLTTPLDRYLLVETKSNWTAIFANGLRVNDVFSPVSHRPLRLNCRGLEVGYAMELRIRAARTTKDIDLTLYDGSRLSKDPGERRNQVRR